MNREDSEDPHNSKADRSDNRQDHRHTGASHSTQCSRKQIHLSFVVSFAMGCVAYFFGPQLLKIYTEDPEVIQCGMEILAYTTVTYFLCGQMDLFPGALRGMGRSGVPNSRTHTEIQKYYWLLYILP